MGAGNQIERASLRNDVSMTLTITYSLKASPATEVRELGEVEQIAMVSLLPTQNFLVYLS
jgi:hypothetical protein